MRPDTLTENADFQELYRHGRSYVGKFLVVYALERGGERTRVGFTVGKKVGKAVARNRVRRRLREAYRLLCPSLSGGYDLVIVGRGRAKDVRFKALLEELKRLLKQAGALTG